MPFIRDKPLEIEFNEDGRIIAIKGKTNEGKKGFQEQMKKIKGMM